MAKRQPVKPGLIINEIPLDNRLYIKEDAPPSVRPSGIILEGDSKIKPYTGTVIAAGPACETVKPLDTVRYHPRAGEKIEIDSETYLAMRETDLYSILNK